FNDGTVILQDRIDLLIDNGWKGALIVFVVLALFLRIRLSFWVALGIPISFLGMFILATWYGITINVLSLFGMILVIGILVDDGIVVGENVYQHYQRGASRFQAVLKGTLEVIPSILSAILTTCLAFSIFFFVEGQMGDFFRDIAFVVIAALGFSLIEVILFLPAHLAHIKDLQEDVKPGRVKEFVENLLLRFRDAIFKPILEFVLRYKVFSFFVLLGALVVTMGAIRSGMIQTTFFPENIEQTQGQVSIEFPAGTPEAVTEAAILQVKAAADGLNARYEADFGKALMTDQEIFLGPGSNQATAIFYFLPSEERPLDSKAITRDLREAVGELPGTTKLSFETATPFGKPLNVSFAAADYNRIRSAAAFFQEEMEATGMVRDMITNDRADQPELNLELNETGRALGLTPQSVIRQVRFGFFGYEAQRLQRGDDEVKVWVRYALDNRDEVDELMNMRIRTPQGQQVPVSEVATITRTKGLLSINHIDGKRQITVEGELAGPEVTSTQMIGKVQSEIMPRMQEAFPDVKMTLEGQQRELGKVQASLSVLLPIIIGLIIALLIITFRSISQSIALMMTIPFGIIGMAWGHFLHGQPISILSFLGFIALAGVIINDGLVFTNTFNKNLREGMGFDEALKETALSRFRPILLTTVTTAAGLLPLLLEKSFQAQFLIPMAITIAYGLLAGSALLTLMLPVFLSGMNRIKVYIKWLWEGKRPAKEEVEKALIRQKNEEHYRTEIEVA
ncbi:MAG: efflux RND transporter permease subunit, partial [Bacteroidota bacterium]